MNPEELAGGPYQKHAAMLQRLALAPPQTLLIEGATEEARMAAALYWGMAANCQADKAPCLTCPACKQIAALEYLDLFIFDGRISNKADEEKPGQIRALRMENIRALKQALGTEPRDKKRIVIITGLVQTREEASNSLLKILEEPTDKALFVLLTPQREQILPTLVSRSFCVTLPWTVALEANEWENEIAGFLSSGKGLLNKIAAKGALDAATAANIILTCQKVLAQALSDRACDSPLAGYFQHIANNAACAFEVTCWLNEAQTMLLATVNPARVLEALFSKLYLLPRK